MTIEMTMVAIGCTLFLRFCKHVRASSNERRPILAQSQRVESQADSALHTNSTRSLHVLTMCRALIIRISRPFLDYFTSFQRAPEAAPRTR